MNRSATILYIPHGGGPLPLMNVPGYEGMNRFLRSLPQTIDRPDAIVVVSAHWEAPQIAITAAARPPLLFDYYGFPPETYEYRYPAHGHPALAERVHELLRQAGIASQLDSERGFDHGLFVPLLLMYPEADIPCIQVSLSSNLDAAFHIELGRALAALRGDNLLILGSGYSFHNLPALMRKRDDSIDPRNQAFEAWLAAVCSDTELSETERSARLVDWESAPHARYCHPREEHLLPLHVCYGVGGSAASTAFQEPVGGFIASAYRW
jgi:aromatic ring-opening dioxygenase catalytic subunit (LigB family)